MAEDAVSVQEALAQAMADVRAVGKGGTAKGTTRGGQQWSYSYRGVDQVVNAVSPAFRKNGLVMYPIDVDVNTRDIQAGSGGTMRNVSVVVTYQLSTEVDSIKVQAPGEAMDAGDKATAKAMSVAWRTALIQLLCIPTDEPDPDEDNYERPQAPSESELRKQLKALGRFEDARIEEVLRDNKDPEQRTALQKWIAEQKQAQAQS